MLVNTTNTISEVLPMFYVFQGQNATHGTPNVSTGLKSLYGNILAFNTEEERDEYHENFYNSSNPSEYTEKCNRTTARKYFLGMSVAAFDEYLKIVDSRGDSANE